MISRTTEGFRKRFQELPEQIQRQARAAYQLFRADPTHPSLRFKQVHATQPIFSSRVGRQYRAVALREGDTLLWFWIGTHRDYERLLKQR